MKNIWRRLTARKEFVAALFIAIILYSFTPWAGSAACLMAGCAVAALCGNPFSDLTRAYAPKLLAYAIIGLGAGMNIVEVAKVGANGFVLTFISITLTLSLTYMLGRLLRTDRDVSMLLAVGTAICGGSAIAAIAPIIRARPTAIAVAMGVVFLLNACALLIFPFIGHAVDLSQHQFGLWSALAIHDTSSVVGAGLSYGPEALHEGVTIKLARALWIVPLAMLVSARRPNDAQGVKPKRPWFIAGFIAVAAVVTWVPELQPAGHVVELIARHLLFATLFLIGTNLSPAALKQVGPRPLVQGVLAWVGVASASLFAIKFLL